LVTHVPAQDCDRNSIDMKILTGTAAAIVLFGAIMPVYGQRDGQGDKQDKQDDKQGQRQDKADKPQDKQSKGASPQQKDAPQAKQQDRQPNRQPQQAQQPAEQKQRSQPDHQPAQQVQRPEQPPQQQPTQRAQQPPQQQPQRAQESRQQQQPQPSQQARTQSQPQRTRQQAQSWQQQRGWLQQGGGWQAHENWQQDRAQHWASDHRTWSQRGGYGGYYVPQASFNLYFGSQHFFRISTRPVIYQGYPRFEYGGYSFLLLDPWPEYWSLDWYASDDVYIDYDDGYYLYNRRYPDVGLAITLAL